MGMPLSGKIVSFMVIVYHPFDMHVDTKYIIFFIMLFIQLYITSLCYKIFLVLDRL